MALSRLFVLLGLCLLWPTSSVADIFDRMLPAVKPRLEELQHVLVPVPDEMVEEAVFHIASYYIPVDAESQPCRNHSAALFDSFLAKELWAMKFVDASSKLPTGVMDGHIMDLGSYDQCLSLVAPGGAYKGQYCAVQSRGIFPAFDAINKQQVDSFVPLLRFDALFSLCVPSSCSAQDVKTHLDSALAAVNATSILSDSSCSSKDSAPFTLLDWLVTLGLSGLVAFIIYCTVHDNMTAELEKSPRLLCFSLKRNWSHMVDTSSPDVAITCLNGIRVLAITWIILGHRFLHNLNFPNVRFKKIAEEALTLPFAPIQSGQLAVETFFLLSGVLMTYSYLRHRSKGHRLNLLVLHILRYIRTTPVLALMALLYLTVLLRLSDGPLYGEFFRPFKEACQKMWWASLLYISNYVNNSEMCVPHGWYLMADYQLHIALSPLLIVLYNRPKLGLSLVATCLVLSTTAALNNAYKLGLPAGGPVTISRMKIKNVTHDYIVTHLRAASFLIGMALGYLLFKIKQGEVTIKLTKPTLLAAWLLSVFMLLFSILFGYVFDQEEHVYSPLWDTLFLVLHRHIYSLGISIIIVVCTLGYGGCVDRFLSWRGFTPLARLTFCAYLLHLIVQTVQTSSRRVNYTLTWTETIYLFIADLVVTFAAAAILHLTVEAPVSNLTVLIKGKVLRPVAPEVDTPLPVFKTVEAT